MYQCCRLTTPLTQRSYDGRDISDTLKRALSLQRCALPPTAQMLHTQLFSNAHPEVVADYGAGTPTVPAAYQVLAAQHLAGSSDSQGSGVAGLFRSGLPQAQPHLPCLHTAATHEEFREPSSVLGPLPQRRASCLPAFTATTLPLTALSLAVQYQHKEHAASQDLAILTASGIDRFAAAEKPRGPHSHQSFGHQPLHWCVTPSSQLHFAYRRKTGRLLHRKISSLKFRSSFE